ncbi:MAG: hypothetical protein M4579_005879 [Chaenotheca gracillima]|nr:MAG: hypothetical protein M4579_005879 [Chaenotheca gracillima]
MNPSSDAPIEDFDQLASASSRPSQPQTFVASQKQRRVRGEQGQRKKGSQGVNVTKIYPREIAKSPPASLASRFSPTTSPPLPPLASNLQDGETSASPLLSALGSGISTQLSPAAYHTNEWTKSLPVFEGSPPNTVGGEVQAGSSPPPSSLLDERLPRGYQQDVQHGSPTRPVAHLVGRPISHPNNYRPAIERNPSGREREARRPSAHSPRAQPLSQLNSPPLPHLPQPHFYAAPQADFGTYLHSRSELVAGDDDYFCGLDNLPANDTTNVRGQIDVVLTGLQGGLDIFKVDREKLELVGRLQGLRGAVIGAKLLPCASRGDAIAALRPLVAVVVHGPYMNLGDADQTSSGDDDQEQPAQRFPAKHTSQERSSTQNTIRFYQTTVEVYSLRTREKVSTLFESPLSEVTVPVSNPMFSPPPPIGGLQISASGNFVTISSDRSGEVYIYTVVSPSDRLNDAFRCLGKIWTTVQPRSSGNVSGSSSSSGADSQSTASGSSSDQCGMALLSVSQRWLAYVPPLPSSSFSINGKVMLADMHPPPASLSSHTAPSQPPVTCAVETPEGESFFNRFAREVTQEVLKGAKWMGEQGKQAWRNYWSKSTAEDDLSRFARTQPASQGTNQQHFPPTHAHASQGSYFSTEPTLVSVLDLEKLAKSHSKLGTARLSPIGTFHAPLGCSYLSFSPQGLSLFTASRKGDVQFVWDLMRLVHAQAARSPSLHPTQAAGPTASPKGPHVRQIARFQRLTAASIVEVAWATPQGERLAIITERKTIHIFNMPSTSFQWPPPRRGVGSTSGITPANAESRDVGEDSTTPSSAAESSVSAAVRMFSDRTQPLIAAARNRRRSSGAGFSGLSGRTVTATGLQGGKYMASGLSKSLGAASGSISNLRSHGETRFHLPGSAASVSSRCASWLHVDGGGSFAVVGGGVLRIHRLGTVSGNEARRPPAPSKDRVFEFTLPPLPADPLAPAIMGWLQETGLKLPGLQTVDVFWSLKPPAEFSRSAPQGSLHPLSYAEIETNAPYQPFHTDQRISLSTFDIATMGETAFDLLDEDVQTSLQPKEWVFGNDIPATQMNLGNGALLNDDLGGEMDAFGPMENVLHLEKDDEEIEQIVVTTRRRKRPVKGGSEQEDGFFEDDCEVLDYATQRV